MSKPLQVLVALASAVFLVIVAVVVGAFFLGRHQQDQQQSRRTPICTEVFNKATEVITAQRGGTLADHVAADQEFFTLTRQRASEVSQSDPGFSEALQQINLTADGLHELDAYC